MPRFKEQERNGLFLAVVLDEQIQPGTFEFALTHLVDHELDVSALDEQFSNDVTGASAYDPRVMLKIVLLAYSRGLISSRSIAKACEQNVQFMAISGDSRPSYTHIAKFVRGMANQIQPLFKQVLLICDAQGLIGKSMFAIDGVKLPSNASKERSGTHAELVHRADRLDKAATKILERHQEQDEAKAEEPLDAKAAVQRDKLQREAQRIREFVQSTAPRLNAKGQELKSNVTDPESAKMATNKGVIQGYAAQAAVDSTHQVIVAADVVGSGSEQSALLPMVEQSQIVANTQTLITADARYHNQANLRALQERNINALIADNQMRSRDEAFADQGKYRTETLHDKTGTKEHLKAKSGLYDASDFAYDAKNNCAICPMGKKLYSSGSNVHMKGAVFHKFKGTVRYCVPCPDRDQCLRHPNKTKYRQVAIMIGRAKGREDPMQLMRQRIDSPQGRRSYSQRIGTVEPVFANIRHNKRLNRFTLRGKPKVNAQWHLYCLVHNIEKIATATCFKAH
jgi:transposase